MTLVLKPGTNQISAKLRHLDKSLSINVLIVWYPVIGSYFFGFNGLKSKGQNISLKTTFCISPDKDNKQT